MFGDKLVMKPAIFSHTDAGDGIDIDRGCGVAATWAINRSSAAALGPLMASLPRIAASCSSLASATWAAVSGCVFEIAGDLGGLGAGKFAGYKPR